MADPVLDYRPQPEEPKRRPRWWSVVALMVFIPLAFLVIPIVLTLGAYLLV